MAASVPVVFWRAVLSSLESGGIPAQHVILAAGVKPCVLADVLGSVDEYDAMLLHEAVRASIASPEAGLTIGERCSELSFHLLGHVLLASPSLREACAALEELGPLVLGEPRFVLSESDDSALISVHGLEHDALGRFVGEVYVAMLYKMLQRYARGATDLILGVHFHHVRPRDMRAHRAFYGECASFDQPRCAVLFVPELLDRRRAVADADICCALRELTRTTFESSRSQHRWSDQVRYLLRQETALARVDFTALASRCGVTNRTLRRRVSREGHGLTELLDEVRLARAMAQLDRPHETIKGIAQRLGYAETSAFHRAFVRWTGLTPNTYRKRALGRTKSARLAPLIPPNL